MTDNANQLLLEGHDSSDEPSAAALKWLARSYESMERWKQVGKALFFSLNGQSDVARNRLASIVRKYFVETPPVAEDVTRWKRDSTETETETVRVIPPKISASNSAYVDWVYIADYILLACAVVSEELDEENQKRSVEYRQAQESYNVRLAVFDARAIIREKPDLNDTEVLTQLRSRHEKAAIAHVKEARRRERNGVRYAPPQAPRDSLAMECFIPLYF